MKSRPTVRRTRVQCHFGYGPLHFFFSENPRWDRTCKKCRDRREQECNRHGQVYTIEDTSGRVIRKKLEQPS